MSAPDTKFIRRFQDHILFRLLASTRLQYVSITSMRHQVQLKPEQRTAPHVAGRNGKVGIGVLVNLPVADPSADADVPGAQMDSLIWLDILSNDNLNFGLSNGANVSAEEVLAIIWQLLNQWLNKGIGSGNVFVDGFDAIEDKSGAYGYRIQVRLRMATDQPDRCSAPVGVINAGTLTLTCATAGAAIYYTTDGSMPGNYAPPASYPANTSLAYAGPVNVAGLASGTTILFSSAKAGLDESDVWRIDVP